MSRICTVPAVVIYSILLSCIQRTICFNYETRLPIVKEGPEDSYFGFSVAEHVKSTVVPTSPFTESLLLVGAPIANTSIPVNRPGGVFQCPLTTEYYDCSLLNLDTAETTTPPGNADKNLKDDQWLGVSVASQGPGGPVAACAHRFRVQPASIEEFQGVGKCYFMDKNLDKDIFLPDGYKPCTGKTRPDNYGDGNLYKYCQAGTDVTITRKYMYGDEADTKLSEYILGIPGADVWLGGIATSNVPNKRSRNLITPLNYQANNVSYNSYLGFSVASAILKDGVGQTYIAGAPRFRAMGAILVLESVADQDPVPIYRIDAEKPASSFGYDVAAADLNGDGFDDVIVGAPQFFDRITGAGGRVYVYINEAHNGRFDGVIPIKLTGETDSLFGQVVSNLRDINLDGYEDFAVGAPYENDGAGAVYIYLGNADVGITVPEAQKITPADLPMGINGIPFPNASFGYAISGGVDLDGNGFPEVTIGAYETNQIAVLRARPVISLEVGIFFQDDINELDPNTTNCEYSGKPALCFGVEACMAYGSPSEIFDEPINIEFNITAEEERINLGLGSRVVFRSSGVKDMKDQTLTLTAKDEEVCTPMYNVVIKFPLNDIFRPIPITLNFRIPEVEAILPEPGDPLPSLAPFPILDHSTQTEHKVEVTFIKECAQDDGECITDLVLAASLNLEGEPPVLKVGEQTEVVLRVSLENLAEEAYDAKLIINYPLYLQFNGFVLGASERITRDCGQLPFEEGANSSRFICELGNPYPEGASDEFSIIFDANGVPADAVNFTITLDATATNEDQNPLDNMVEIFVDVESNTDILISGKGPEQTYFGGVVIGESAMVYVDDIGLSVDQVWTVYNEGPGAVNTATVTISFPYEVANGKWLLYMTEAPSVVDDKGTCTVSEPIYINELGLKERPRNPAYTPVPTPNDTLTRKRRQTTAGETAKSTKELTAGKEITLDCMDDSGSATCFDIVCHLDPLTDEIGEDQVSIVLKSRLWNSTFLEDYLNVKWVKIVTWGEVEIESAPYITQTRTDNDRFKLVTTVIPDVKDLPPSKPLAWWIYLVAVLAGIIFLILLIILLWKVGFFARPGTSGGGPCGFFERKTGYKYATVTQQQASGKAKTEKTAYYDDMYYS